MSDEKRKLYNAARFSATARFHMNRWTAAGISTAAMSSAVKRGLPAGMSDWTWPISCAMRWANS